MQNTWKIDFLVPTFNRPQKLHHLLTTGLSLKIPGARFVIIDDGSSHRERVPGLGEVSTAEVYAALKQAQILYLKNEDNIGLAANIMNYYHKHCAADYTMLMTDKDKFVDSAPIISAIQKLDRDPTLSMVVIPILQNDSEAQDQLLTFRYWRMPGSFFIKKYIDDTMLQHCVGYSIVRVAAAKKIGVPRPLNLRAYGLEDSFGFDLDFFLMVASTGDVDFGQSPHVCRTILGGLTERFPLTFAYCYYQYAKRALGELCKKGVINRKDVRKSVSWWNLLILRGVIIVNQPSERRSEVDTSRIKRHLKMPVLLYFLMQCVRYQFKPTPEMKTLLRMQYGVPLLRWLQKPIKRCYAGFIRACRQLGFGSSPPPPPSSSVPLPAPVPVVSSPVAVAKFFRYCNIGGGPDFDYAQWINLEAVAGPKNPTPFILSPTCRFPLSNQSMEIVYSSHVLEHCDDATVSKVLGEAQRVLKTHGHLVIKIPDFMRLHQAWQLNDLSYFSDEKWNFPAMTPTFLRRNIRDSIHARAAYLFCGFWNTAYGHLFGAHNPFAEGAYHGPPPISEERMIEILRQDSMSLIAAALRREVIQRETDFTFNHQNAWSVAEFCNVLLRHGFMPISTIAEEVRERFVAIPAIDAMADISAYFIARPMTAIDRAAVWRDYDKQVKTEITSSFYTQKTKNFETQGFYWGAIDNGLAEKGLAAIAAASHQLFKAEDYVPGYITYPFNPEQENSFNAANRFKIIDMPLESVIQAVLNAIQAEVAECLGSPWRVLNVRAWETVACANRELMYDWHTDGFVDEIFKIMVYFTPHTRDYGGIELALGEDIIFLESHQRGRWILFRNSAIKHRGMAGTTHDRLSIEITLSRSQAFRLTAHSVGLNAHWPMHPSLGP